METKGLSVRAVGCIKWEGELKWSICILAVNISDSYPVYNLLLALFVVLLCMLKEVLCNSRNVNVRF